MSKLIVIEIKPEELMDARPNATLSYMLFKHRMKLKARGDEVNRCLSLSRSKLSITNRLISKTEMHIFKTEFEDLRTLGTLRKFSKHLKGVIVHLLAWKNMTSAQKKMVLQSIENENKAKQQLMQIEESPETSIEAQQ